VTPCVGRKARGRRQLRVVDVGVGVPRFPAMASAQIGRNVQGLVSQGEKSAAGSGIQRAETMGAGGGDVVDAARFDRSGPGGEPSWVGDDLHVGALGFVLAGLPGHSVAGGTSNGHSRRSKERALPGMGCHLGCCR